MPIKDKIAMLIIQFNIINAVWKSRLNNIRVYCNKPTSTLGVVALSSTTAKSDAKMHKIYATVRVSQTLDVQAIDYSAMLSYKINAILIFQQTAK